MPKCIPRVPPPPHTHTHRWRPKYRYAHGYERQDGPHWLGGYDDINGPEKEGADSESGKGLPGVNVYDWSGEFRVRV